MRFLNKVIFINSATIRYAEVMVDGNVHLIGTQGVGKSTLLRAILFFYNADTLKLGISKEKKSFAEYYFQYQNSYLIFEVVRETGPFCVVAFKSQGKVSFRFFDGEYKRDYFVTTAGHAYEKWEENRKVLDENSIDHTRKIDRYEEYRDILYGNNETGKKEFDKYTLLQSKQYQNIPRTIQNVFLNSKLEAEFIKQTIIMSLNEEDINIDLQSYTHHLKGFETQLKDIDLYKQPHVVKLAETTVNNHAAIKHLEGEKNKFSLQLSWAAENMKRSIPKILDKIDKKETEKKYFFDKINNAEQRHRAKTDKIKAEINVLESDIKKAKEKQDYYTNLQIENIIKKVDQKNDFVLLQQKLEKEKQLLTIQFGEITLRYDNLFLAKEQSLKTYEQSKKEEQLILKEKATEEKENNTTQFEKVIATIKQNNEQAIKLAVQGVEQVQDILQKEKVQKATATHLRFFETEMDSAKSTVSEYQLALKENSNSILHLKNSIDNLQKQAEIEETATKQQTERAQEKANQSILIAQTEANEITNKLADIENALYGWLNNNKPAWENNIGKLLDEKLLFNKDLNPEVLDKSNSMFGVSINLNQIPTQVKTVAQYKATLKTLQNDITTGKNELQKLQTEELAKLEKTRKKYQQQLKDCKDDLKQTTYKHEQDELQLQQAIFSQKDWEAKAKEEKQKTITSIDAAIAKASEQLVQAQQNLQQVEEELNKQIKAKEREQNKKANTIEAQLKENLTNINELIVSQQLAHKKEIKVLQEEQSQALKGKGADTEKINDIIKQLDILHTDLKFIETNRDKVAEYKKDKKELIDKVDVFKSDKLNLDKQCANEEEKYILQKEQLQNDIKEVDNILIGIQKELFYIEEDEKAFGRYQHTDAFLSLPAAYTEAKDVYRNDKSCKVLIEEVNRCYYKAINRLDDLKDAANKFLGNYSTDNIFKFTNVLTDKYSYLQFAEDLNEFINNSKIEEFEKRVNERFANVITMVGKETGNLMSKAGEIQKVISNINKDFDNKNFVGAIRKIELRIDESANKIVQLLMQIKIYNDDNAFDIGGLNLFTSIDTGSKNKKAVDLLKQLSKSIAEYRKDTIELSDSFELKFRIEENQNDTGWVEKLSNVGSEGTDVLVKAMINIMLLNVFKEGASKRFKDFRLHCMMDEIGKLHPNNIKGILQFANDRNILLINGSPTETNALNYKHIYKLEKDEKRNTKIKRIVSQLEK